MKFIKEIKDGEVVTEHYLCKHKQMLKSRAGKNYLCVKLQDKTGVIDGKIWELNNDIQSFEENDFIKIDAVALVYQNEMQLNIKRIRRSKEGEIIPSDYIPATQKDIKEMRKKINALITSVSNKQIRELLERIFIRNQEISDAFESHSAAKSMHHGYLGGLLEHTLSVAELCDFMSGRYIAVNRDILVAVALLHDIGKVIELSDFPTNDYTDEGQLLGHIYIGTELISQEINNIDGFNPSLASIIKHCILAHHGEYEFGSPKRPKTIEAFILHCADNMDAKVKAFEETIHGDGAAHGNWVGYHKLLERNIRRTEF